MAKITPAAFFVMLETGMSDPQIAAASGISRQAVSKRRLRLEAKGLLQSGPPAVVLAPSPVADATDRQILHRTLGQVAGLAYERGLTEDALDRIYAAQRDIIEAFGYPRPAY